MHVIRERVYCWTYCKMIIKSVRCVQKRRKVCARKKPQTREREKPPNNERHKKPQKEEVYAFDLFRFVSLLHFGIRIHNSVTVSLCRRRLFISFTGILRAFHHHQFHSFIQQRQHCNYSRQLCLKVKWAQTVNNFLAFRHDK